ncbi:MAG: four-helix bundle copper-binding protein, partial [Longimicrobiales bacterium]
DMRLCIRNCLACAEVCGTVARVISRPGPHDEEILNALLDACAAVCRRCAAECEHHGAQMAHCRTCAQVCRNCADVCEEMSGALVPA